MNTLSLTELRDTLRDPAFGAVTGVTLTAHLVPTDEIHQVQIHVALRHGLDVPLSLISAHPELPWQAGPCPGELISREALLSFSDTDLLSLEASCAQQALREIIGDGTFSLQRGQPGRYSVSRSDWHTPTTRAITAALRGPATHGVIVTGLSFPTEVDTSTGVIRVRPALHFRDQVLACTRTAQITWSVLHALQHDRSALIIQSVPDTQADLTSPELFTHASVFQAAQETLRTHVNAARQASRLALLSLSVNVGPALLLLLHEPLGLNLALLQTLTLGLLGVNTALIAVILILRWTDLRVAFQTGRSPKLTPDPLDPAQFSFRAGQRALRVHAVPAVPAAPALEERSAELREKITTQGAERSLSTLRDVQRRAQTLKDRSNDADFTARIDQLISRTQTEIEQHHEHARTRSDQQLLTELEQTAQTELRYLGSLPR